MREPALRPLVIGASGLVGRAVAERLEDAFPDTVAATRAEIDLDDRWRVEAELERLAPTVVVNCAAISDVDACERDPLTARRVNAEGPAHLAAACRNARLRLVHISTDYVFRGEGRDEYREEDAPDPVNEYGRSKLLGEMAVLEALAEALVVRVSFVFGAGRPTFLDRILERAARESGPLPVVDGWRTKPTPAVTIAGAVEALLRSDETGLWHVAGGGAGVTRLEFARTVLELAGHDAGRAVPLAPAELKLDAPRPASTPLSTARFEARFGPLRPWTEAAREYLARRPA